MEYRVQSLVSSLNRVEQALRNNADEVAKLVEQIKAAGDDAATLDLTQGVSSTLFSVLNTSNIVGHASSAIYSAAPRG